MLRGRRGADVGPVEAHRHVADRPGEGAEPAGHPHDPGPENQARREAEGGNAQDQKIEGKDGVPERHHLGHVDGIEYRLREHEQRQDRDVEGDEGVFQPRPLVTRADEDEMDKAEGGEAGDAEVELERMLRARQARHDQEGAEQRQGHQAALDGDAQAGLLGVAKGPSQSGLVVDGLGWHAMVP
jgi:hypothetical protein